MVTPKTNTDPLAEMIAKLKAENEALKKSNDSLKAQKAAGITMKVAALGGLSVYGMGRFPTTLYAAQWEALLAKSEEFKAFIAANKDKLSSGKDDARFLAVRAARAAEEAAKAAAGAGTATAGTAGAASAPKSGSAV